ncbi:MAG: laccase domain-containing protein [Candidatus Colwellbacteria bacterium]|nr:laccase domain-containing protein [Candidatus Colwellbacteria bacterium]
MFSSFEKYPNLIAALSTRKDGSLRLKATGNRELDKIVNKNREGFVDSLEVNNASLVCAHLVHGNQVQKKEKEAVGIAHGGWRGLSQNILEAAIQKMIQGFGSKTENIIVAIGPGIGQCHFEVEDDVLSNFKEYLPDALVTKGDKTFLDLKEIAKIQLMKSGVKDENIEISPECTHCLQEKYFSYRRDKPEIIETMMAVMGIMD